MGSLLPGWDCEPHEKSMGIKEELHTEMENLKERRSSTHVPRVPARRSVDTRNAYVAPPTAPPFLSRKSAPSSVVVRLLEEEEKRIAHEVITQKTVGEAQNGLYARDKWWRRFSSANLNDVATEVETTPQKSTYVPQFNISGGYHYNTRVTQ